MSTRCMTTMNRNIMGRSIVFKSPLKLCDRHLCLNRHSLTKVGSLKIVDPRPILNKSYLRIASTFPRLRNFTASSCSSQVDIGFREKSKFFELKKLFQIAFSERWTLASGVSLLFISSSITMAVPFALGHVIDVIYTLDPIKMKASLSYICGGLVSLFFVGGLTNFGRVYLLTIAGQRITRNLRSSLFSSIMKQEVNFFDRNRTGELINRLSSDATIVSQAVTINISDGLRSLVMISAGVGMMFYMSSKLAIVGLSIVPPTALMAVAYGRYLRNITRKVQDTLASSTQIAEERISNIRTVRSFSQEIKEIEEYNRNIDSVLALTKKESLARGIFFGLTGLSGNLIVLIFLYYGGTLVTESALTVGHLSSFLLYAAYVGVAFGGLSSFYSELNKGLGASTRLFQLMDRIPTIRNDQGYTLPVDEIQGKVTFKNVTFAYPTRPECIILKDFSLEVPAGKIVAIVGVSGSGKSTMMSLLLRFYHFQEGNILLDNKSICDLNPAWLRSLVASVGQVGTHKEPILFSTSIFDNILYGSPNPAENSYEQVERAAFEANALHFIEEFPKKFDTVVGERGVMLSGGQKQRIAIARAIIRQPRILLLDEATSALDAESESLVKEALEKLMKNKTVITIAHRLSTIRNADQIAVLQDGKIQELGSYDVLMQNSNGIFTKLVEKQTFHV